MLRSQCLRILRREAGQCKPSCGVRTKHSNTNASVDENLQHTLDHTLPLHRPDSLPFSSRVARLVTAYREHGHKLASIDPLGLWQPVREVPELHPATYGFASFNDGIYANGFLGLPEYVSVGELVTALQQVYCSTLSAEFHHLQSAEERSWFADSFEAIQKQKISPEEQKSIAKLLLQTQAFDAFLGNKFPTLKRYGGEGAEGNLVFMDTVLKAAAGGDYQDVVICMPHRGRLNVLAINLNYDPSYMFLKITGKSEFPEGVQGFGDVLSHLSTSVDLDYEGKKLHVSMVPNPSHLEANNPVAVGKARGRQQSLGTGDYRRGKEASKDVLCIQIHGDASFTGQGIVAETFTFANLPYYSIGGSVHFITNNQIGFTTPGSIGRSSLYASDIGKMNSCPVLHVNGDCPEDVMRATRLAFEYKHRFQKDVIIDLICYRLHGHNEVDDPTFTQPTMYGTIKARRSLPDVYSENLVKSGVVLPDDAKQHTEAYTSFLREKFSQLSSFKPEEFCDASEADVNRESAAEFSKVPSRNSVWRGARFWFKAHHLQKQWSGFRQASNATTVWDTGFPIETLKFIGGKSVEYPEGFIIHPHLLKTHVKNRLEKLKEGKGLDWATAEALAVGSLLLQGFDVRISGQDVGRGTFSHRHALLTDQRTNANHTPLNHMVDNQQTIFEVARSILSEEAVLGFEYGMSIENPKRLAIWEAQFGDFFTGAQIIIDTYITAGETKWLLQSGLVMLLPHGYDGAGPEHSSCRIERFLQQTDSSETKVDGDDVNFSFVNATTPAQYFHVLRRQMIRNFRKPLVMATPKTGLRLAAATSELREMEPGTSFASVLPDTVANPANVDRVVFLSGKHYFTLDKERQSARKTNVALIRLEELCPFPAEQIATEMKKYPKAKEFIWSQEEPRNMGAWSFVAPRFQNLVGVNLKYAGRSELPAPAVGIATIHEKQNQEILSQTFQ